MLYTSYFSNVYHIHNIVPDMTFISIAGYSPKSYHGLHWKHLAPKREWWNIWHDKFRNNLGSLESKVFYKQKYYETVLDRIDVDILDHDLSKYKEICFLCYELPLQFCHRHIFSDWLRKYHYEIDEFSM